MDQFLVEGGARLQGRVRVSGAKNAVLPIMAASLLIPEPVTLRNVPQVADVATMMELLSLLGVEVDRPAPDTLRLDARQIRSVTAPYEVVKRMRASIYVLGPLLAREGRARVSLPGGCAFGPRPVNFHIQGLRAMGTKVDLEEGYIVAEVERLRGATLTFDFKSVGATAQLMMAAALAEGRTLIANAAQEPEIVSLAEFLNRAGAKIRGAGTDFIIVEGVEALHSPGEFRVIPDRIEAGTFAVAAFMTGGDVFIEEARPDHLVTPLERLRAAGAEIEEHPEGIRVRGSGERPRPLGIHTSPFPGFPTDLQAQFMAMLTVASGTSVIREGIYPDRFKHAFELLRLGADITVEDGTAVVRGVEKLKGAPVMATDLRASAALVLAGLIAEGKTLVDRIYHLDRGYERFEEKLAALGARIRRIRR